MQAVWSATLNVRTSRFSFVTVAFPTSRTMNCTLMFFSPGRMSLIVMQSVVYMVRVILEPDDLILGVNELEGDLQGLVSNIDWYND